MARDRNENSRRRYQPQSRGGGTYVLVLALLVAVLGGLIYGFRGVLLEHLPWGKKSERVARRRPEKKETPARPVQRAVEKIAKTAPRAPARKPPAMSSVGADEQRVRMLIAEGLDRYRDLEFQAAVDILQRVDGLRCSDRLRQEARQLQMETELLDELTKPVKLFPEAKESISRLELAGDRVLEGVIAREDDEFYYVASRTSKFPIPKEEVRKVTRLSDEERQERLLKHYADATKKIETNSGVGHYLKGRAAYVYQLKGPAFEQFQMAFKLDSDLKRSLFNYEAGKLLRTAIWRDSIGSTAWAKRLCRKIGSEYPDSMHAADAGELLARIEKRQSRKSYRRTFQIKEKKAAKRTRRTPASPADESAPKETTQKTDTIVSASAGQDVQAGNRLFDEALVLYRQALSGASGSADRNRKLGEAGRKFHQCMRSYQRALNRDPNNSALESRITDANMLRYGCMKYVTMSL